MLKRNKNVKAKWTYIKGIKMGGGHRGGGGVNQVVPVKLMLECSDGVRSIWF
jgi:hypothetical protein